MAIGYRGFGSQLFERREVEGMDGFFVPEQVERLECLGESKRGYGVQTVGVERDFNIVADLFADELNLAGGCLDVLAMHVHVGPEIG